MKKINSLIIVVFISAISLPAIFGLILPKQTNSFIENRRLAEKPKIPTTTQEIKEFPDSFDKYYTDHFGIRWTLLYLYRQLKFLINDAPIDSSVFGNEKGWVFYSSKIHGDVIGDYRNINQFTKTQLETFIQHLSEKQSWLAKQGIEYLFVIAPSKHYIYPEKLPDYIKPIAQINMVEQLSNALAKHPEINFINLAPNLLKEKNKQLLYFKADSHWNFFATNIAQFQIANKLTKLLGPTIKPYLYLHSEFTVKQDIQGDLAQYMGLGDYFTEEKLTPVFDPCTAYMPEKRMLFSTYCSDLDLNVLVFRDSFFSNLQPFISQYFKNSTFVWQKMTYKTAQERILDNKPNIVIEEWVDRLLPSSLNPNYEY
jgi:hypothetical protein